MAAFILHSTRHNRALMGSASAIELNGVSCRFGHIEALRQVDLTVPDGSIFGLIGPNGAGKSTLIDVVTGMVRPGQGTAAVFGYDVRRRGRQVRALMGVLPQESSLYTELTAVQNLQFAAALYGVKQPAKRIADVLDLVGLTARSGDVVGGFSGGMKRRLAIARSMVHDPRLLILDEPTLGVDVDARHQIWMEIRAIRAQGRTVVLTTNYLDEAEALCDQLAILRNGRLVAQDSPAALAAKLGRCVDLECAAGVSAEITRRFEANPAVIRSEVSPSGVTLYLQRSGDVDALVKEAMTLAVIGGFRSRAPDLAELIRGLPEAPVDA